ncbi:sigma-70 family RNA polymerase sigma factor [Demequina sp.]|uniref:sigma-70 family RNA polymerase sigma factor n=1 Tax=Demequina sp. TaxID=2050685 RepID=UPI003D111E8A
MAEWEAVARELVDARYGVLVGYARLVAGAAADAEDLVQEALISTFGRRRTFASIPEAESYVRRAIVSRFLDTARRSSRTKRSSLPEIGIPGHADAVDLSLDLTAALAHLTPRERACVVLRHLDGLSTTQTAHALGIAEGSVKRYVADGLATLNARLGTNEALEDDVRVQSHKGGAK